MRFQPDEKAALGVSVIALVARPMRGTLLPQRGQEKPGYKRWVETFEWAAVIQLLARRVTHRLPYPLVFTTRQWY